MTEEETLQRAAEIMADLKQAEPKDKPKPTHSRAKSKPAKKQPSAKVPANALSDPNAGLPVQPEIWQAVHIYQRPGDTPGQVASFATRERQMHGPSVLVFAHRHHFGDECDPGCRVKWAEGSE